MRFFRGLLLCSVVGLGLVLSGCGSSSSSKNNNSTATTTSSYVNSVATADGVQAVYNNGAPPAAGSGPCATVTGPTSMVVGGSATVSVDSGSSFTTLYISVNGVDGYYQITLPAAVTTEQVILTLQQSLPGLDFTVNYAAADTSAVGCTQPLAVVTTQVGTGPVQVSVSWDTATDVDLHLVEPDSEEIYYGNPTSTDGGTLDLDSNAGCSIDNVNNENITWPPPATPPHGTYTVRVDYWDDCAVTANTNYTVTVRISGQNAKTFTGSFAPGTYDNGAAGAGTTITTFTY